MPPKDRKAKKAAEKAKTTTATTPEETPIVTPDVATNTTPAPVATAPDPATALIDPSYTDPLASFKLGAPSPEPAVDATAMLSPSAINTAPAPVTPAVTDPLASVKLGSPTSPSTVDYASILSQGSPKPAPAPVVQNVALNAALNTARAKQPALDINADNILSYTDTQPQGSELEQLLKQRYEGFKVEEDPQIREYLNATEQKSMPLLSQEQNFPSASNNIFKGSYQGSEVGNIPLFAESSLIPFGAFDARQRAMEASATTKAKESLDFYKESAPQTKRFSVQPELDETFRSGQEQWVANAKSQYGKNWATALKNDPKYGNWLEDMRTVAKYNDGIVDFVSDIQAKTKSGKFVASPELESAMADFTAGVGGLGNPLESKGGVGKSLLGMRAYYDLDKATNEAVDQMIQTETAKYPGISNQGIYDLIVGKSEKGVDMGRIIDAAQGVYDSKYADGKGFTYDQVLKSMIAKLGPKSSTYNTKTVGNQYSGAGGSKQLYSDNNINKQVEEFIYGDKQKVLAYDTHQFDNIEATVPNVKNAIDIRTGKQVNISGASGITLGATTNVICDEKGIPVDKVTLDAVLTGDQTLKDLRYSYQTFAIGTVAVGTGSVKNFSGTTVSTKIDDTYMIPLSQVNTLLNTTDSKGNVKVGVRTDLQIKQAKKRNDYIEKNGDPKYGTRESFLNQTNPLTEKQIDDKKKAGEIIVIGE